MNVILKKIDDKTRIKLARWYFPALGGTCYLLQRKINGFWITKSWIYTCILENDSIEDIENWLLWDESVRKAPKKTNYKKALEKFKP